MVVQGLEPDRAPARDRLAHQIAHAVAVFPQGALPRVGDVKLGGGDAVRPVHGGCQHCGKPGAQLPPPQGDADPAAQVHRVGHGALDGFQGVERVPGVDEFASLPFGLRRPHDPFPRHPGENGTGPSGRSR